METPELNKLKKVAPYSQVCGEFYEWLIYEKGYVIAEHIDGIGLCNAMTGGVENLLAEFFNIDQNKVEAERRVILDQLREANGTTT